MNPIKVLLVDDSEADGVLISRKLHECASVTRVGGRDTLRAILQNPFDVALIDLNLGSFYGREAIELTKSIQPDIPIIVVTGSTNPKEADAACEFGAMRFFMKDHLEGLDRAVKQAKETSDLKAELKKRQMRGQRDEILGTLAASLAHDQRNYLGAILMGIDLLREKAGPNEQRILDSMLGSARKGADQVEQMMTFAKGENGVLFKSVKAEFLLGEVRRMMQFLADASNIRLHVRTEVGTADVNCDPVQINTVLLNMAINAQQAMPHGGDLFLESHNAVLHEPPLEGPYVCLTIRDTGHGIPEDVLPKIFTPYFSTKGSSGTGLGLAMVKPILDDHHGCVKVKSDSAGTIFSVYLPVYHNGKETVKKEFDGKGVTILLVDDEEGFRGMMQMILENANYKVLAACNGPEALSLVRSNPDIRLMISDLGLPIMCGMELAKLLNNQGFKLPTIYITGREFDTPVDPQPDRMLHKPITRETMLTAIRDVLAETDKA